MLKDYDVSTNFCVFRDEDPVKVVRKVWYIRKLCTVSNGAPVLMEEVTIDSQKSRIRPIALNKLPFQPPYAAIFP